MNWDDFRDAFNRAQETMRQANSVADDMARMLAGRLHGVNVCTLERLKRELRDFNIQTHEWKDRT